MIKPSKIFDPNLMSSEEIISRMKSMNSKNPGSVMGLWGASGCYKKMYKELIRRNYQGEMPPEQYSPPPLERRGGK